MKLKVVNVLSEREFIISLPVKIQREIVKVLKLLEEVEILTAPYFKKLKNTDDIWEARSKKEIWIKQLQNIIFF